MRINTARKILTQNGIAWSNFFDLSFVLSNTSKEEHKNVTSAIERMIDFLTTGR